ncbi:MULTISPECIES: TlpA family protein disulfide reductase [Virgibacillus]|uniref:Thiol-disulfide oxidoreductase ResA n=2 Tax=Virgibacillus TaxID=84406 RepID=A0A024QD78_9BACI|nr:MULTISPECIES: TlpA disulfide reductase family protein [Virgibacillus]EQB36206.1 hypothetical protein M948_14320 [Virgibacillus sp. CM-4]MYL42079.1 redoxin domain-containing protein [Virgibacillus massiliensis]GGJ45773.1 thiol:disulfide interchange protein tlpA [Virgibacillus kapii]CDQ39906.1 Thiol-disulfide oxidoreductase ResA [Virgibacillus massiliensis]
MYKKIFGVVVIVVLAGIVLFNYIEQQNQTASDESNAYNDSGDSETQGGSISSVDEENMLKVGNTAPDFTLETLNGETLQLSELRGKKVILNFWATWCPPCREEMPAMEKFYNDHQEEVEIVAVNLTDSEKKEEDVHTYNEKYKYSYPIPLDRKSDARNAYQVVTVPTTYFIDSEGNIQQIKPGPMDYEFMEDTVNSFN